MQRHARVIIVVFAIVGCAGEGSKRYWAGVMDGWRKEGERSHEDWLWDPHRRDPTQDYTREYSQSSQCDDDD